MRKKKLTLGIQEEEFAKHIKLSYVYDTDKGITREKISSKEYTYYKSNGKKIVEQEVIERINSLAIPPAYKKVWICEDESGHIQATGISIKGKKQYFYHHHWHKARGEAKFDQMIEFAQDLPTLRRSIEKDLKGEILSFDKVMALIIILLDKTHIRIGNESSAHERQSYGLTTLRKKHLNINDDLIQFNFKGKSNQDWSVKIEDPKLQKIIEQCQSIPGYRLFKYLDDNNVKRDVTSADVNRYLQIKTDKNYTAKNFRTWHGTVKATDVLLKQERPKSKIEAKKKLNIAVKAAAKALGNTPSVCRKNYIHHHILESYSNLKFKVPPDVSSKSYFSIAEAKTLALLQNE